MLTSQAFRDYFPSSPSLPSQETIVKPSSPTILFLHIASEPAPEAVTGENDKTEYK